MKRNHRLLNLLSILCVLFILAACAPAPTATQAPAANTPVTLTYLVDDSRGSSVTELGNFPSNGRIGDLSWVVENVRNAHVLSPAKFVRCVTRQYTLHEK